MTTAARRNLARAVVLVLCAAACLVWLGLTAQARAAAVGHGTQLTTGREVTTSAAPDHPPNVVLRYLARHGMPANVDGLVAEQHSAAGAPAIDVPIVSRPGIHSTQPLTKGERGPPHSRFTL